MSTLLHQCCYCYLYIQVQYALGLFLHTVYMLNHALEIMIMVRVCVIKLLEYLELTCFKTASMKIK